MALRRLILQSTEATKEMMADSVDPPWLKHSSDKISWWRCVEGGALLSRPRHAAHPCSTRPCIDWLNHQFIDKEVEEVVVKLAVDSRALGVEEPHLDPSANFVSRDSEELTEPDFLLAFEDRDPNADRVSQKLVDVSFRRGLQARNLARRARIVAPRG